MSTKPPSPSQKTKHNKKKQTNKTKTVHDDFNSLVIGRIIYQTPALKQTCMSNLNAKRIKATPPRIPVQNLKTGRSGSQTAVRASRVLEALGFDAYVPLSKMGT